MGKTFYLYLITFTIVVLVLLLPFNQSQSFTIGQSASYILGQRDFKSDSKFGGGLTTSSKSLWLPHGLAIDQKGNLWVADTGNSRLLEFSKPYTSIGKAAISWLGQPDTQSSAHPYPPSAGSLNSPRAVAFDADGNLWVSDSGNHRVLEFKLHTYGGYLSEADVVIGQPDFKTGDALEPSATSLNHPEGIEFDNRGDLWVADSGNNRVLQYIHGHDGFVSEQAASTVLGQPDFNSKAAQPLEKGGLKSPSHIKFSNYNLWIADQGNHRVLEFVPSCVTTILALSVFLICTEASDFENGQAPSTVLGQPDFKSFKGGPVSASSMYYPNAIAFDADGNLWVSDSGNWRVLQYYAETQYCKYSTNPDCSLYISELLNVYADLRLPFLIRNGEKADVVLGVPHFESVSSYDLSANYLRSPGSMVFDSSGNAWIADTDNNRILGFSP